MNRTINIYNDRYEKIGVKTVMVKYTDDRNDAAAYRAFKRWLADHGLAHEENYHSWRWREMCLGCGEVETEQDEICEKCAAEADYGYEVMELGQDIEKLAAGGLSPLEVTTLLQGMVTRTMGDCKLLNQLCEAKHEYMPEPIKKTLGYHDREKGEWVEVEAVYNEQLGRYVTIPQD